MDFLREATTQMSSTGQSLSTKTRWMVINKEIVFDNDIIPSTDDYSGGGIIPILKNLLTEDIHNMTWQYRAQINWNAKSIAQELWKVEVHNYYDLIMASWNNINWVYHLHIDSNIQKSLSVISAYSLYLTIIGEVDKALDPMQWDYMTLQKWSQYDYRLLMVYGVAKLTPFGKSILPTPILLSSISKATTTAPSTDKDSNLPHDGEILLLPLFSPVYRVEQADDIDNVKEEEVLEENDDFDTGMIHVLTRILNVPLNHAIAQALRNDRVLTILSSNITAIII